MYYELDVGNKKYALDVGMYVLCIGWTYVVCIGCTYACMHVLDVGTHVGLFSM